MIFVAFSTFKLSIVNDSNRVPSASPSSNDTCSPWITGTLRYLIPSHPPASIKLLYFALSFLITENGSFRARDSIVEVAINLIPLFVWKIDPSGIT